MATWSVPGYSALKALGSGGFGEVMLARHDATGTQVAIKYLRGDLLADQGFADMFRAEAAVLASLDDPNVVRLYEYVESPAGAAIVMELVEGVSLREILDRAGGTTAEAALVVLRGSLLGLSAAHQGGVVHRDYKPENILINGEGASKLTDFGIAARAGEHPIPAGTLLYAAPEQLAGAPASPASDVYSATATFYECLTGNPPFSGNAVQLIYKHSVEPVPLEPVPEQLRPLVAAGMAKEPEGRPADAASFVTGLQAVAAGAYGQDWADRGRSHLGEAALLLAALWPSGAPPANQDVTVQRVSPARRTRHIRRITPLKAAIAAGVVAGVVAGGAAVGLTHPSPARKQPPSPHRTSSPSPTHRASSSPTSPVVSPGHSSPQDAVDGFYQGELAGAWSATCSYVDPAAQALCLAGTSGQGSATGHVTVGNAVISGSKALVPVTGRICAPSTPCVSNSDPALGMPPSPSQFSAYYAQAVANGTSSSTTVISPIPCRLIGGKWYIAFG